MTAGHSNYATNSSRQIFASAVDEERLCWCREVVRFIQEASHILTKTRRSCWWWIGHHSSLRFVNTPPLHSCVPFMTNTTKNHSIAYIRKLTCYIKVLFRTYFATFYICEPFCLQGASVFCGRRITKFARWRVELPWQALCCCCCSELSYRASPINFCIINFTFSNAMSLV